MQLHVIKQVSDGVDKVGGSDVAVSVSSIQKGEKTIAASQTNSQFDIEIDVANAKVLSICADQDCTIKTNSTSTPGDTLTLEANKPLVWTEDDTKTAAAAVEKFLDDDVTTLYVTTGGNQTTVKVLCGK